ncbi:hypothetical protein ACOIY0_33540, partial [Burkholderia contaminans]|uniref:hypothetical protein n=1 Tax=Burkholderia contaminans TaxID=488447 RepID=UPI003B97F097
NRNLETVRIRVLPPVLLAPLRRPSPAPLRRPATCATAGVHWSVFAPFLGFITTHSVRGHTVPLEHADTLAWLTSTVHIKSFVQFLRIRSNNVTHHGVITLLSNARSHLRPSTGFLWLHSELLDDLCLAGDTRAHDIAVRIPANVITHFGGS